MREEIRRYIGGEHLMSTYVVALGDVRVAVDPGPSSTYTPLDQVTHVLCTHIHLDHCGAAGNIEQPVYVHERYVKHLADPERLWESALQVLGDVAREFGRPLPGKNLQPLSDGQRLFDAIDVLYTPGHAPHHMSFYLRDTGTLFVGDSAGVYMEQLDAIFPTTPIPFRPKEYVDSLRRMAALRPSELCYPHFACTRRVELLTYHLDQINAWMEVAREVVEVGGGVEDAIKRLQRVDEHVERVLGAGRLASQFFLRPAVMGLLDAVRRMAGD